MNPHKLLKWPAIALALALIAALAVVLGLSDPMR